VYLLFAIEYKLYVNKTLLYLRSDNVEQDSGNSFNSRDGEVKGYQSVKFYMVGIGNEGFPI
jgi:hypothetical protein